MSKMFFAKTALTYIVMFAVAPFLLFRLNEYFGWYIFSSLLFSIIGCIVLGSGIVVISLSFRELFLKPKQDMINPLNPPSHFICEGIFSFSRNPMYIGYLLIIFSEFFLFLVLLQLIFFGLVALLIHLAVVYIEEPSLEKQFGKEYLDYKKNVPRWIIKNNSFH